MGSWWWSLSRRRCRWWIFRTRLKKDCINKRMRFYWQFSNSTDLSLSLRTTTAYCRRSCGSWRWGSWRSRRRGWSLLMRRRKRRERSIRGLFSSCRGRLSRFKGSWRGNKNKTKKIKGKSSTSIIWEGTIMHMDRVTNPILERVLPLWATLAIDSAKHLPKAFKWIQSNITLLFDHGIQLYVILLNMYFW